MCQGGFPRHLELKIPDQAEQSASLQSLHAYPAICDDLRLVVHFRRSGSLSGVVGMQCILYRVDCNKVYRVDNDNNDSSKEDRERKLIYMLSR